MSAAAIQATFADFRIVKGRKVAQLVLEVPLEAADAALATLGGLPRPDAERWFAIARLDLSKPSSEPEKTRRPFDTLPPAQQAAMRCNEPGFWHFTKTAGSAEAAAAIRTYCGIFSRSQLNTDEHAAQKWRDLDDQYFRESRGIR